MSRQKINRLLNRWWPIEDRPIFWLLFFSTFIIFLTEEVSVLLLQPEGGFGFISLTIPELAEITHWLPLASKVSEGNLFPNLPSINPQSSGILLIPYFSVWIHGLLISLFGVTGSFLIGNTVFPSLAFALLFSIFRKNLSGLWSGFLSLWALISFFPLNFFNLLNLPFHSGSQEFAYTSSPLQVLHLPIPAISLVAFLFVFRMTIDPTEMNGRRLTLLSMLWAFQSQFQLMNGLIGVVFWLSFTPFILKNQLPKKKRGAISHTYLFQIGIVLICLLPSLIALASQENLFWANIEKLGPASESEANFFTLKTFILIPLAMTVLLALFFNSLHSITKMFWPLILLFCVEGTILSISFVFELSLFSEFISSRLAALFLHIYFITPFIFIASQPAKSKSPHPAILYIRKIFFFIFGRLNKFYLPLLLCFLGALWVNSLIHRWPLLVSEKREIEETWKEVIVLTQNLPPGAGVISNLPATNLLIPILSQQSTLWVSSYVNSISVNEIIERFALYAKVFSWPKEKFFEFMLPGRIQTVSDGLVELREIHISHSGYGFWLALHQAHPEDSTFLSSYHQSLNNAFDGLDLRQALKKFNIKRVISRFKLQTLSDFTESNHPNSLWLYEVK